MANGSMDFQTFDDLPSVRPTIPDGEYHVRLLAKVKDKKDGNGKFISYDAIVQDGEHAGYRIMGQVIGFAGEYAYQLKRTAKQFGIKVPAGLTVYEAAAYIAEQMNGSVVLARIGKKPAQERNDAGAYVDLPGEFQNTVKGFIKA